MKKSFILSFVFLAIVLLTGCGQKQTSRTSEDPAVANSDEPGKSAPDGSVMDTKDGYLKAKELTKDQNNATLRSIILDNGTPGLENKIQYIFSNGEIATIATYDLAAKEASVLETSTLTPEIIEANQSLKADYSAVTDEMINFGLENALATVEKNDEYKKWKEIHGEDFEKYLCTTNLNEQNEWEWILVFFKLEDPVQKSAIKFSIMPGKDQSTIISNSLGDQNSSPKN